MCDNSTSDISISNNTTFPMGSIASTKDSVCETAEEAVTTDSEECSSELRYKNFDRPAQSTTSNATLTDNMTSDEENDNFYTMNRNISWDNIQIPIVGYEIMEERARFTVYKLKVENKLTGDFWYVFRRYTDFVRLCNRLRDNYPDVTQHLPRKRWLKNNFDPIFLDERVNRLQTLVNAMLNEPDLICSQEIQDFFCLNEPPVYSETSEESKAIFEALEETITDLKQQIQEKDNSLDKLQTKLHLLGTENESLRKVIRNSMMNCSKCQKECENLTKLAK
nr:sorting nexin-16 [Leptinotarsa decemlineata]